MEKYLIITPDLGKYELAFVDLNPTRVVPFTFMREFAARFDSIEDAEYVLKAISKDYDINLYIIKDIFVEH